MTRFLAPLFVIAATAFAAESAPATPAAPVAPAAPAATAPAEGAMLVVKITGITEAKGDIRIALHNTDESFPKKWDKAFRVIKVPVPTGKTEIITAFTGLKPGTYAVIAHHDADSDGQLKRYIIGMPAEGMINSGTQPTFGAPSWKKSSFTVPETKELSLKLRYL